MNVPNETPFHKSIQFHNLSSMLEEGEDRPKVNNQPKVNMVG